MVMKQAKMPRLTLEGPRLSQSFAFRSYTMHELPNQKHVYRVVPRCFVHSQGEQKHTTSQVS